MIIEYSSWERFYIMANKSDSSSSTVTSELLGIGTWAWGDRMTWGFGSDYDESDLVSAFNVCVDSGIRLFDTAEVYGNGKSESILGGLIKTARKQLKIATKFMPYPWRLSRRIFWKALEQSLQRLGLKKVDLYQLHWPFPPMPVEYWVDELIEAKKRDLVNEVGVSNYDLDQMMRAHERMMNQGVKLATNQVEYNLLNRKIEKSGVLKRAGELGIKIIAYSPLAQGMLTGKYNVDHVPTGTRRWKYSQQFLAKAKPLIDSLEKIGASRGGKTPSQVALNWIIQKGALPIPGAKTVKQAQENVGAINWKLTTQEIELLDDMSNRVLS